MIGGEGNGGVIYPPVGFNRDSLAGAALLLAFMAATGRSLTAICRDLPHYEMVKTKIECRSLDEANDLVEKTKEIFKGADMILTEGVKVVFTDAWLHVRASNTEPIIRIIAEAKDKERAEALVRQLL